MGKKALSLIEIVVAFIILSLVMVGLVETFLIGKTLVRHGHSRVSSAELAKYFLGSLYSDVRADNLWPTTCLGGNSSTCPVSRGVSGVVYTANYTITNITSGTLANLTKVRVNIVWNETTASP
ncbi:MAG: hypothetical protein PHN63_04985 [Candidatus Omnitrophica bacterium]|nr:hypothetical protein [Candidatus Omnitrophota bacterium]